MTLDYTKGLDPASLSDAEIATKLDEYIQHVFDTGWDSAMANLKLRSLIYEIQRRTTLKGMPNG